MAKAVDKHSAIDMSPLLRSSELSSSALKSLIKVAEGNGFRLVDWERRGTPVLDKVVATAVGPASGAGELVQSLFKVPQLKPNLRIFPRGVLAFDEIQVEISATAHH